MLNKPYPTRQRGISLIELMVGIAISLILLAGVITVMLRISTAGGESVQATRLNQQLRGTLDLMSKELQRAGYVNWRGSDAWGWDDAEGKLTDANDDGKVDVLDFYEAAVPAINAFGRVTLFAFPTPGNSSSGAPIECITDCDCILYSYDVDGNGSQNTDLFELFGFRWNGSAVQMRTGGDVHSCNSGTWQDITDANVEITRLAFELIYADTVDEGNDATVYSIVKSGSDWIDALSTSCIPGAGGIDDDKCLWRRKVNISLEGQISGDAGVIMQLRTDVKIKNDYFNTAP